MSVRESEPTDLPRLRAIQSSALDEPWPDLLEMAVEGPLTCHVIADGEPLGYAIVVTREGDVAYVPELAIRPDRQGEGLGSQLLSTLCTRLAAAGHEQLRLTVQASDRRARHFYADHGFETLERLADHFENGDGLLLARPLNED